MDMHRPDMDRPAPGRQWRWYATLFTHGGLLYLLLAAFFRNNTDNLGNSKWWSSYSDNPFIATIKNNAMLLLAASVGLLILRIVINHLRTVNFTKDTMIIFIFFIYCLTAALLQNSPLITKFALLFIVIVAVRVSFRAVNVGEERDIHEPIFMTFVIASAVIVSANFLNFLTGHGWVADNPRMFGIAGHPNFTAIQMATAISFLSGFALSRRGLLRLGALALIGMALVLLQSTGSRTGVMVLAIGLFTIGWAYFRFPLYYLLLGGQLATFFLLLAPDIIGSVLGSADVSSAFNRGASVDTRAESWGALLAEALDAPLLGNGVFPETYSENSFLRLWIVSGPLAPIMAIVIMAITIGNFSAILRAKPRNLEVGAMMGVFIGLCFGAIFEGYLSDTFTYVIFTFFGLALYADAASFIVKLPSYEMHAVPLTRAQLEHPSPRLP